MTRNQRPSDHLPTLAWQLRSSLEGLSEDADGPDARDFRRFLRRAVAEGWRAAATGKFSVLREVIDAVREARPEVDDALPKLSSRAQAAVEVQQALGVLYVGEDELREVELENRLSDRGRHPTERAVLKVLASADRPLRQAEVHERLELPEADKPTPSWIGQILRELNDHGYTRRQLARARGRAEVAHYRLAPRSLALCEQLGIDTKPTKKGRGRREESTSASSIRVKARVLLEQVLDASKDPKIRRIAAGSIASSDHDQFKDLFPELLSLQVTQDTDELGRFLLWTITTTRTLRRTGALLTRIMSGSQEEVGREEIRTAMEQVIDCNEGAPLPRQSISLRST